MADGIEIHAPVEGRFREVLTPGALSFLESLHREFEGTRRELLATRAARQAELDAGGTLDFLESTRHVREGDWRVSPPPADLRDRRVEITGPTDRKMVINALNSGARGFMADFEDANSPTWRNMIGGHVNLTDAIEGTIEHTEPDGRVYRLGESPATLLVRPRGWHLPERHITVDGEPIAGALVDFGLHFFHNARRLLEKGSGPYFYLPKLESHREARLWNEVFCHAQDALGVPRGSVRATVLIETVPAAFEMEEILYELRDHSAGLNAGRWDYMFSMIKCFRSRPEFLLPDRNGVTMTVPFMRAYTELLVRTCHRRGAHAMGGMAAFIPSRRDPEANERALANVREDKAREAGDGFDGTWVAHPDSVAAATGEFDRVLGERPNQVERQREDVRVTAADLLDVPSTPGEITEAGLRNDVNVGIQYVSSWL
ncbi:MAG: malate synthase A, partial [Thermoleophilaceae bacterium]|nr:malate synthase A [Thermoleophilaceae bacterium]